MIKRMIAITILAIILVACVPSPTPPSSTESPTSPANPVPTETPPPNTSPVVILVIDDFGTDNTSKPPSSQSGNCIVYPDGQGGFGTRAVAIGNTGKAHGELVYSELQDLITARGGTLRGSKGAGMPTPWPGSVELWEDREGFILLVAVDTEGFTTQVVSDQINTAIDTFNAESKLDTLTIPAAKGFVLNMSFAIIPCEPLYKMYADPDQVLAAYLEILGSSEELKALDTQLEDLGHSDEKKARIIWIAKAMLGFYDRTSTPQNIIVSKKFSEDPLFRAINVHQASRIVISVGAAGNFNEYKFPFAPAIWDSVVSVSADYEGACVKFDAYSNPGEVLVSGLHPDGCDLVGTSFAAPRISLQEALYLLQGGTNRCSGGSGDSFPPLGYATEQPGDWKDLPLPTAISDYCSGFPN